MNTDRANSNRRQLQTSNRNEINSSPPRLTGRARHHSSDTFDHTTTRQNSSFYLYKRIGKIVVCRLVIEYIFRLLEEDTSFFLFFSFENHLGQCRNKSNEQQLFNDFDRQSENFFSFSSSHKQFHRSYSRERSSNSLTKVR